MDPINNNSPRKEKQRGSGFTNIQKVIGANKGNRLGSSISGSLQQQGEDTKKAVEGAKSRFGEKLEQGSMGEKQAQERTDIIQKAKSSPGIGQQDLSTFSRFNAGQYSGPKGLEDKQGLIRQGNDASQLAGASGSAQGREGLLQRFVNSPQYTRGTLKTDAMLLGGAAPELRQASSELRGISRDVNTDARIAENSAEQASLRNKAFGEDTRNMLSNELTGEEGLITGAETRQGDAKTAASTAATDFLDLKNALNGQQGNTGIGVGGPDNRAEFSRLGQKLGLSPEKVSEITGLMDRLKNSGLSDQQANSIITETLQFNQMDEGKLGNLGTFMDQDQANSISNLQQLSGQNASDYGDIGGDFASSLESDTGNVGGLAATREYRNDIKAQSDKYKHYTNNFRDARNNAMNNPGGDRNYFVEQDPELGPLLAQRDQLMRLGPDDPRRLTFDSVNREVAQRMANVNEASKAKRQQLESQYSSGQDFTGLQDYKNFVNDMGRGKI